MAAPNLLHVPSFRAARRRILAVAALALGSVLPLAAQSKPDQVWFLDAAGQTKSFRGVIKVNSLDHTKIEEADGRERTVDSGRVTRVEFGDVPDAFTDGVAYFDRKDFENAAAKFQVAAGDAATRLVVKAAARLHAAQAWMKQAGQDPSAFPQALSQLDAFLAEFPDDRETPQARLLLGRARWLGGDPAGGAQAYAALYAEIDQATATRGYSPSVCYRAGLAAAEATLAAGDVEGARKLFAEVSTAVTTVVAGLEGESPERIGLEHVGVEAHLGEGFCLLAQGSTSQARTFFQGQLSNAPSSGPQRFGARLGLGEALQRDGRYREAQLEFAQVSGLDYTSRDRVARALVGLAECALALPDTDGHKQAKSSLETVRDHYGDTPSALRAQELLKTL